MSNFMGYKTILLGKNLDEVVDVLIERTINRHVEIMNHFTGMKIAWDNLLSVHISTLYARILLDGVLNHFAER